MVSQMFIVGAIALGMMGATGGNSYYVSPKGQDANPGTEASPWQTVQKAADAAGPGDTVFLMEGTYPESVQVRHSGADGSPITFKNYRDQTPIIDGAAHPNEGGVFIIYNQKYITVSGLRVINGLGRGESGIYCENSGNLVIEKCHTVGTGSSGIKLIQSTDVLLDGNEIEHACQSGAEEDISVKIDSDRIEIRNNHVHNSNDEGIDIKEGARNVKVHHNLIDHTERQGLYTDAWNRDTFNIEFYCNVVHDCGFGIAAGNETGGLLHNVRIYNNVVYNCEGPGLVTADWGRTGYHIIDGVQFVNNTVYNAGTRWGGGFRIENADAKNLIIRNNIFSHCGSPTIQMFKEPMSGGIDHCLFDAVGDTQGNARIIGDPMFVDPAHGDFHLKPGSPAVGAGSADGAPAADMDGQKRPLGKGVDVGAYELGSGPPPGLVVEDAAKAGK